MIVSSLSPGRLRWAVNLYAKDAKDAVVWRTFSRRKFAF
jgi:hypothetical protein